MRREVSEGISYVRSQTWLWATLSAVTVSLLFFLGPLYVLMPYVVKNSLDGGAQGLGLIFAAGGVGAIAAALFRGQLGLPRRPLAVVYLAWTATAFSLVGYALVNAVWQAMIVSFFSVGCLTTGGIVWTTVLQRAVPARMIGRVSSLDWVLSLGLAPLSYALTGPIAACSARADDAPLVRDRRRSRARSRVPRRARRSHRRHERGRDDHHGRRGLSSFTDVVTARCVAAVYGRRMLARAVTHALVGLEPRRVDVEVHIDNGIPGFAIVGLVDRAVQEAKHRIRSGIASAELELPDRRITVNLAPAQLRKEGSRSTFRSRLRSSRRRGSFPPERLEEHAAVGELGLDGRLRRVGGVLAVAEGATRARRSTSCSARPTSRGGGGARRRRARSRASPRRSRRVSARRDASSTGSARTDMRRRSRCPTWPTCAATSGRGARSRSPPRGGTTCCSRGRRGRGRRCSRGGCPASCRRSSRARRSR